MAFAHGLNFLKSLAGIENVNVDWITESLFDTQRWVLDGKRYNASAVRAGSICRVWNAPAQDRNEGRRAIGDCGS
jgi:hypothetical protein